MDRELRSFFPLSLGFTHFVGVDFGVEKDKICLRDVEGFQVINTNFNQDGFLSMIEDNNFDCVISSQTFEHICHHPMRYLGEGWRVLRSGGTFLFDMPNPCTLEHARTLVRERSPMWGDISFAETPKINLKGEPLYVWDVHFREYCQPDFECMVQKLPRVRILEKGFKRLV